MKQLVKNILNGIPYVRKLKERVDAYDANSCFPPGHFYSPIVSVEDIKQREDEIWSELGSDQIPGIDLNTEEQRKLVEELSQYYPEIPFDEEKKPGLRYNFGNGMYSYTDGIVLYGMMRHFKPSRIIEIGSGHSSALMLDVNDMFFDEAIQLSFIEPYPARLYDQISDSDKTRATILEKKVQEVDLDLFSSLERGDILFVDSTHVSKCGSDVNHILFKILPRLSAGVLIHFHDIFYPFEYPREWVHEGRNWNENYMLRAFLMNNNDYKVLLFSHYLHEHHVDAFKSIPDSYKNKGGNLWLQKLTE